jgi:LDH2 family malate/lactate/ureidoglycolate dehydrogenase
MKLAPAEIASLGERILQLRGVEPDCAGTQIELLLEAEMRGYASHGLLRLRRIVERIEAGVAAPNAKGRHSWQGSAQLLVDGERGLGPVVAMHALAAARERALKTGIAIAAIRNSNHIGMLAWYGEKMAAEGLILIGATTSEALVHPWGGRRAMLGTNPLCIAVPAVPQPLVLDMATSLVSMGKIHDHANRGARLPEGWALDAAGNPTTDAVAAKTGAIAPFGGAKGYALGLALEVLVTSLAGSAIGTDVRGTLDSDQVCNKGDIFILIAPNQDPGVEELVSAYLEEIRTADPADAQSPIAVPGDRARRTRAQSLEEGVELEDALWQDLLTLAQSAPLDATDS